MADVHHQGDAEHREIAVSNASMRSTKNIQMQLRTLFIGGLCLLAGVVCFAKGYPHRSVDSSTLASFAPGERQGVSPPCPSPLLDSAGNPRFTSLAPRYVTKRISDLKVGEEVVAKDPESGEITTKRVANVFRKDSDHLRILQVRNPRTDELQTIETTDDHPFWVRALGQWIDAKDLKLGDRLDDVDGGTAILESTSRELHPDGIPVFNFEVEDFHTYFVRAHGSRGPPVLTHNVDCNKFQTIINASPTNSVGLGSSITVGTPGIDGLPGTGVFGDGVLPQINVDTGTAVAFVSEGSPIRHSLKSEVAGQQMVMSQTAANEFQVNLRSAGPLEKARADRFMNRVQVIPDTPSPGALGLRVTGSVGSNDKIIFGTGDYFGITTMTADAKFLRGAKEQGVAFQSLLHPSVPFKGM